MLSAPPRGGQRPSPIAAPLQGAYEPPRSGERAAVNREKRVHIGSEGRITPVSREREVRQWISAQRRNDEELTPPAAGMMDGKQMVPRIGWRG